MSSSRKAQGTYCSYYSQDYVLLQDRAKVTVECWISKARWQTKVLQVVIYPTHTEDMVFSRNLITGEIRIFKAIISLFHVYVQSLPTKMWLLMQGKRTHTWIRLHLPGATFSLCKYNSLPNTFQSQNISLFP